MNEDIFDHDLTSDMASTPNAAELNAALPQLMSSSTTAFDAFDDLDINQTNFSELDEEEQDIAHIILSDPSLLGLDCLVGAGPPKSRIARGTSGGNEDRQGLVQNFGIHTPLTSTTTSRPISAVSTPYANNTANRNSGHHNAEFDFPSTASDRPVSTVRPSPAFNSDSTGFRYGNGMAVQTGNNSAPGYGNRAVPRSVPGGTRQPTDTDENGVPTGMLAGEGLRVGSPPKPLVRPPTMRKACDLCHQAKQKCSGERPACERCRAGGWPCHYAIRQRRRAPGSGSRTPATSAQQSFAATGGLKALSTPRSIPVGQSTMSQRPIQPQRLVPFPNGNTAASNVPRQPSVMLNTAQKPLQRSMLPPPPPLTNERPIKPIATTSVNGMLADTTKTQETAAQTTMRPRVRSIAGPIKAGMPNFGQFSANAFLAKKFPELMPGASRPIVSPGQLPYMSKAAAMTGASQQSVSTMNHNIASSTSALSPKPAPKRPSKKRKTKNGGGVASAEAENDLNLMDGFGYLYGFQDPIPAEPGPGNQGNSYTYHGPVGWVSSSTPDQVPGSTPLDAGTDGQPLMRAEEYLQVIRDDGLLADLDLDSHLSTLGSRSNDVVSSTDYSPSHTQVSDDVLQDVASILDPRFTDHDGTSAPIKVENTPQSGSHESIRTPFPSAVLPNEGDDVLRLLEQQFAYPSYDSITESTAEPTLPAKKEITSSGDGSMTDLDTALFGDGDRVSAANLAAFNDQIFHATFSAHDSQRSEASSVYHDSGEGQLPDFMMEDLTDFAAWSAQAEQPFDASAASSQFGTNPQQSPVNAFQHPFPSGLAVDVSGLDDLIQLNAKNEEEQYALDLASMFNEPEDNSQPVSQPNTTEDVIMDGGLMNIEELEQALRQHTETTSTPVAIAQETLPSPGLLPKMEEADTPFSTAYTTLPNIAPSDDVQGRTPPLSHTEITTPGFADASSRAKCQHEVDISQTVWALSRLQFPAITLGALMPHLTRALEILVSLHVCSSCSVNPAQTIPQLALLSRTCSILLRPHPLTPSPLPLTIAGGRTTFTGLAPEIEVHIVDILWANWRSHSLQKVFADLERRINEHAEECARKRQEMKENGHSSMDSQRSDDGPTPEELRCDMMTLALKRFRAKVR